MTTRNANREPGDKVIRLAPPAETVTGEQVMTELAAVLAHRVPQMRPDDPLYLSLVGMQHATKGCLPRAARS